MQIKRGYMRLDISKKRKSTIELIRESIIGKQKDTEEYFTKISSQNPHEHIESASNIGYMQDKLKKSASYSDLINKHNLNNHYFKKDTFVNISNLNKDTVSTRRKKRSSLINNVEKDKESFFKKNLVSIFFKLSGFLILLFCTIFLEVKSDYRDLLFQKVENVFSIK